MSGNSVLVGYKEVTDRFHGVEGVLTNPGGIKRVSLLLQRGLLRHLSKRELIEMARVIQHNGVRFPDAKTALCYAQISNMLFYHLRAKGDFRFLRNRKNTGIRFAVRHPGSKVFVGRDRGRKGLATISAKYKNMKISLHFPFNILPRDLRHNVAYHNDAF